MSIHQSFLTATPLAFLLLFPVFFYYCLRNLLLQHENSKASLSCETRIPEYLIRQHVDKTRQVRKSCSPRPHKASVTKSKLKYLWSSCQTAKFPFVGSCSIGLEKYALINGQSQQKMVLREKNRRNMLKIKTANGVVPNFAPTCLTTVLEDVEY